MATVLVLMTDFKQLRVLCSVQLLNKTSKTEGARTRSYEVEVEVEVETARNTTEDREKFPWFDLLQRVLIYF